MKLFTKNILRRFVFLVFFISFIIFSSLFSITYAETGVPSILSYQGRLTDASGNLLGGAGTPYFFKFSFWDSATVGSGTQVWPATSPAAVSLTVKQGVFNVNIGDIENSYPDILNYNFGSNKKIYLQVQASANNSSFETLSPRQRITSAPFAEVAGSLAPDYLSSIFADYFTKTESNNLYDSLGAASTTASTTIANHENIFNHNLISTALQSFTELDPLFTAWDKSTGISITESQISDLQSYLTAESDTLASITARGASTSVESTFSGGLVTSKIRPITDSTTAVQITKADGTTSVLNVDTTNARIGIGTTAPSAGLHIVKSAIINQLRLSTNETDSTNKFGGLVVSHYLNAEEPFVSFFGGSSSTDNTISFGGGSSTANSATIIRFFTAENSTTVTGTERMRIQPSGNVGIGTTAPTAKLHITGSSDAIQLKVIANATQTTAPFAIYQSDGTTVTATIDNSGNLTLKGAAYIRPSVDSTAALKINKADGTTNIMTVDSTNARVGIGTTTVSDKLTLAQSEDSNGIKIIGYDDRSNHNARMFIDSYGVFQFISTEAGVFRSLYNWFDPSTFNLFDYGSGGYTGFRDSANNTVMTIVGAPGNVGIGVTAPASKLHIGGGAAENSLIIDDTGNSKHVWLQQYGGTSLIGIDGTSFGWKTGVTTNPGETGTLRMRLYAGGGLALGNTYASTDPGAGNFIVQGNVGIGTTSPSANLEVAGLGAKIRLTDTTGAGGTFWDLDAPAGSGGLGLLRAGTQLMRIRANGNIGFGLDATPDFRFGVEKGGSTDYFGITNATSGDVMVIKNNGNVGIGTNAPVASLHIVSPTIASQLQLATNLTNNTAKYGGLTVSHYNNSEEPLIGFYGESNATENIVVFGGGSTSSNSATKVSFFTAANTTTLPGTERMTIKSDGLVGIGNTSPNTLLDVSGGADGVTSVLATFRSKFGLNTGTTIRLANSSVTTSNAGVELTSLRTDDNANTDFIISSHTNTGTPAVTEKMRIKGISGNVGIGTTAPVAKLDIVPNSDTAALRMYQDNATGYYYTFKVDNAVNGTLSLYSRNGSGADILGLSQDRLGKVGIGTTAPAGLLHVSSDTAATGLTYFTQANASADSFDLNFRKARGTAASPTVITTVDELGVINFTGYGGAAGYITGAAIKAISQGTIADSRVPANLTFWTGTDAQPSVLTKRLTISPTAVSLVGYTSISGGLDVTGGNGLYVTQNLMVAGTGSSYVMGKFGIGTTTPDQSLDVRGNIAMGRRAQSAIDRFIGITDTTGGVGNARGGINITQTAGGSTSMTFHTGTWGTTDTDSMFIASNGNVGIGTTTPGQKLTVVGNGQFTAVGSGAYSSDLSLTADGTLTTSASDIALKMNLVPLNATTTSTSSISILDKVIGLKPYTFNWISDPTGSKDIGLIAQDVEGIFPEITFTNKVDGYKGINYSRLPVILVSAIQELSDKVVKVGSYVVDGVAHYTHVIAVKFTGEEAEITNIKTEKICFDEDKKVCITESILNELIAKNPITCITSDTSTATASTTDTTDSSTEPMPTSTTDALASTTEEIIPEATSTEPVIEESVATSTEEVILEVTSTNT